jgi:superfamily II DNA/RNA helicase
MRSQLQGLRRTAPSPLLPRTFGELFRGQLAEEIIAELRGAGILTATEVQEKAISAMLAGRSAIVSSPTGSGKTIAFVAPLVELMRREAAELRPDRPTALIVVPSRELCMQVLGEAKRLSKAVGKLRVEAVVGGAEWKRKTSRNVEGQRVDLMVCTPGLLLGLRDEGKLFTSDVKRVVFDEADTLFGKGFLDDMKKLMVPIVGMGEKRGEPRQVVAVGATMPESVVRRIDAVAMNKGPRDVITARSTHCVPASLKETWVRVTGGDKMPFLEQALTTVCSWRKCLVFVNSPECARAVEHYLTERGHLARSFHREVPANLREENLKLFRSDASGAGMILVCTDAASRGLDLTALDLVVNYDFPPSASDYLHRVGRTARMGRAGQTASLVQTKQDRAIATAIQSLQQSGGDLSVAINQSNISLLKN